MDDSFIQPLIWVGLAIGMVAVFMVLELLLRTLSNRYCTPQDRYPPRIGTQLPRVLR
jgi:hypothetical protein